MNTKDSALIVPQQSALDLCSAEILATLKATVAKDATDAEFKIFIEHCRATKLNPFKKEVWFIKTGQGVQIMTGINGFYAIANSHPQYDGMETEIVEEGGKLRKAVAKVYRKDRSRPSVAEAYFDEYGKTYGNWKTMPRVMLTKCAESMALRKAFPQELNGLYTTEEMPQEYDALPHPELKAKAEPKPQGNTGPGLFYALDGVDAKRKPEAEALLKKAGAVYIPSGDVWHAPGLVPKLKNRIITEAEANARALAKSNTMERVKEMAASDEPLPPEDDVPLEWEVQS